MVGLVTVNWQLARYDAQHYVIMKTWNNRPSKFPFTLTKRCQFHTAVQILKSLCRVSPPYLHDIFQGSHQVVRLFVIRVFTNYGKHSFYYTKELFCGAIQSPRLLRLSHCFHFEIIIKILNCICFFCSVLYACLFL